MRFLLAAMLAVPAWLLPVNLHGGPVMLTVAGDGAGGVTVRAVYKNDGHAAEALRLVLNAHGDSGRSAGPAQLNASAEGRGFYSSGPLLTPGRWEVTVTSPEPNPGAATATVNAAAPQSPPAVTRGPTDTAASDTGMRWWAAAAVAVLAAASAFAAWLWWRRKST